MRLTKEQFRLDRELTKLFPGQVELVRVKMKYTRQVNNFLRKVDAAEKATASSKLIFKQPAGQTVFAPASFA